MNSTPDGSRSNSPVDSEPSTTGRSYPENRSIGSGGSGRSSLIEYETSRANPYGPWDRAVEREILRASYNDLDAFRRQNPGVDPVHNPNSLRERLLAYRARANIHRGNFSTGSQEYNNNMSTINSYNNFLTASRPPFLNERV